MLARYHSLAAPDDDARRLIATLIAEDRRMRSRLRQLGVDPDRLASGRPEGVSPKQSDTVTPEQAAEELAKLREARDSGTISDEEYEQARERLRRY